MTDRDISRRPTRGLLARITGGFQIGFGVLTLCLTLVFFSGILEMALAWQDNLARTGPWASGKGQPQVSQLQIQNTIHERMPWLRNYQRGHNAASLVLSAMMIAGGVGLLYLRRWSQGVTLCWAVLSLLYSLVTTTVEVGFVGPVTMEVTAQVFEDLPPPPPGQPDLRPMMKSMVQSMGPVAALGPVLNALFPLAWAITVLVFMLLPSNRGGFPEPEGASPPGRHSGVTREDLRDDVDSP